MRKLTLLLFAALLWFVASPAQAHTDKEMDEWFTSWSGGYSEAYWDWYVSGAYEVSPQLAFYVAEYQDMDENHPAWDFESLPMMSEGLVLYNLDGMEDADIIKLLSFSPSMMVRMDLADDRDQAATILKQLVMADQPSLELAAPEAPPPPPPPPPKAVTVSTPKTSTPAPAPAPAPAAPKAPAYTAGVEQWRGLVSAYFSSSKVATAMCIMYHESRGDPNAYNSSSGASGLFQFIPSTWANMVPDNLAGNVFDPETNVRAAAWLQGAAGWTQWSPYKRGECRGL